MQNNSIGVTLHAGCEIRAPVLLSRVLIYKLKMYTHSVTFVASGALPL
jgi:hypothetical protein